MWLRPVASQAKPLRELRVAYVYRTHIRRDGEWGMEHWNSGCDSGLSALCQCSQ